MKATLKLLSIAVLCFSVAPPLRAQQQQQGNSAGAPSAPQSGGMSAGNSLVASALDDAGIKKYLLGPGDVLDLRVFGEQNFTGPLVVNDEGFVEVPFLKPILAKCRTDIEIKKDIIAQLSDYLQSPQVSLRISERQSRPPAVVFGAVRQATRAQMNRKVRLLELLAVAGGTTEQAGGDIQIYHTEPVMCPGPEDLAEVETQQVSDEVFKVPFNLYQLTELKKGNLAANPFIRPGDIVIVSDAPPIFVTGPGVYAPNNLYLRNEMSLTRAIAQVGGVRKGAKTEKIRIYRMKPGQLEPEIIEVNYDNIRKQKAKDVALQAYDIIEVTDGSPWSAKNLPFTLLGFANQGAQQVISGGAVRIIN